MGGMGGYCGCCGCSLSLKTQQTLPPWQLDVLRMISDGRVQTPLRKVGIQVPMQSGIGGGFGVVVVVVVVSAGVVDEGIAARSMQQVPPLEQILLKSVSSQRRLNSGLTQVPGHS